MPARYIILESYIQGVIKRLYQMSYLNKHKKDLPILIDILVPEMNHLNTLHFLVVCYFVKNVVQDIL